MIIILVFKARKFWYNNSFQNNSIKFIHLKIFICSQYNNFCCSGILIKLISLVIMNMWNMKKKHFIIDNVIKAIGETCFFRKKDVVVQVSTWNLLFSPFWLEGMLGSPAVCTRKFVLSPEITLKGGGTSIATGTLVGLWFFNSVDLATSHRLSVSRRISYLSNFYPSAFPVRFIRETWKSKLKQSISSIV